MTHADMNTDSFSCPSWHSSQDWHGEIRSRHNTLTPELSSYWLLSAATHCILSFCLQIKKKSIDKAKQEERMSKEFAAMEEAALKAYQEDLKRMERESSGNFFDILLK